MEYWLRIFFVVFVIFGGMAIPVLSYAAIVRSGDGLEWKEIRRRLGLTIGAGRWWAVGVATAAGYGILYASIVWMAKGFGTSTPILSGVLSYENPVQVVIALLCIIVIVTRLWEEVVFRGLVAGLLFRRLNFWTANAIQSLTTMVPSLTGVILLGSGWRASAVFAAGAIAAGLFFGWLRDRSDSIGPTWLIRAVPGVLFLVGVI